MGLIWSVVSRCSAMTLVHLIDIIESRSIVRTAMVLQQTSFPKLSLTCSPLCTADLEIGCLSCAFRLRPLEVTSILLLSPLQITIRLIYCAVSLVSQEFLAPLPYHGLLQKLLYAPQRSGNPAYSYCNLSPEPQQEIILHFLISLFLLKVKQSPHFNHPTFIFLSLSEGLFCFIYSLYLTSLSHTHTHKYTHKHTLAGSRSSFALPRRARAVGQGP